MLTFIMKNAKHKQSGQIIVDIMPKTLSSSYVISKYYCLFFFETISNPFGNWDSFYSLVRIFFGKKKKTRCFVIKESSNRTKFSLKKKIKPSKI